MRKRTESAHVLKSVRAGLFLFFPRSYNSQQMCARYFNPILTEIGDAGGATTCPDPKYLPHETYPQNICVRRSAKCYRCGRFARSSTKVSIVSARMQNPVIPADLGERDVKLFPTAFGRTRRTVHTSFLSFDPTIGVSVHHDEWTVVAVQRQQVGIWIMIASVARDLDNVVQVVLFDPCDHAMGYVNFYPGFCTKLTQKLIKLIE